MENVDLNIDNYDYEDILNLFSLDQDFGENGLKNAKKIVLATHPDKSGLNKEYFLFFSKAYKILNFVYTFREHRMRLFVFVYQGLKSNLTRDLTCL